MRIDIQYADGVSSVSMYNNCFYCSTFYIILAKEVLILSGILIISSLFGIYQCWEHVKGLNTVVFNFENNSLRFVSSVKLLQFIKKETHLKFQNILNIDTKSVYFGESDRQNKRCRVTAHTLQGKDTKIDLFGVFDKQALIYSLKTLMKNIC